MDNQGKENEFLEYFLLVDYVHGVWLIMRENLRWRFIGLLI